MEMKTEVLIEQYPKPAVKITVTPFPHRQLKQIKYLKFSVLIVLILTKTMIEKGID